ncbi:MAG: hypothetical protein RJA70_1492 [Pseudomonadota bacterium]|jgi:4-amino-4-deoxy-L-arabinose transferase-like glycosyltransferase
MTERAHAVLALSLLLAVGCVTLLLNLDGAQFDRWDEAAYGGMARNAIDFGSYLVPLNEDGQYAGKVFSKPPLTIWAVALSYSCFGFTLKALRLPFALATLGSALVCFFWGWRMLRDSRLPRFAPWFGFAWGLAIVVSDGAMQWGRRARIEPMLVFFLLLALASYARTSTSRRLGLGWALAAGFGLAGAFLTKQLAFGLAALPILLFELARVRRDTWSHALYRLSAAFGVALSVASAWLYFAYAQVGQKLLDVMFGFSVVSRFAGLSGTKHFNTLNRIPDWLERSATPFPWVLGVAGTLLAVGVLSRETAQARLATGNRSPHESLLVALFLLTGVAVLENATRSVLPWYAWSLVPPTLFGCAWWVYKAVEALRLRAPSELTAVDGAFVALGSIVLWASFAQTFEHVGSKLNAAVGFGAVAALLAAGAMPRWPHAFRWSPSGASLALAVLVALALAVTPLRYPAYMSEAPPPAAAMSAVASARKISIGPEVLSGDARFIDRVTMFGKTSKRSAIAPWTDGNRGQFDARVEGTVLPSELAVAPAVRVTRVPGGTVYLGDLTQPPFQESSLAELLAKGPLTFEAEHLATENWNTLSTESDASGEAARTLEPWFSEDQGSTDLSLGQTLVLPAGAYIASFFLRWDCKGYRDANSVTLEAADHRKILGCSPAQQETYVEELVPFSLGRPSGVKLRVAGARGRRLLSHDKTELWSAVVYNRERRPPHERAAQEKKNRKNRATKRSREPDPDPASDEPKDAQP